MSKHHSSFFSHATIKESNLSKSKIESLEKQFDDYKIETVMIYQSSALAYTYERTENLILEPHQMNSVTKSVLSTLIGIAIDKEQIDSLDHSIATYFPYYKGNITIRQLLTMTSGVDPTIWKQAIESPDSVEKILTSALPKDPRNQMVYNNADSHLLSAILEKATEMNPLTFAEKYLFRPLKMNNYSWDKDSFELPIGGYGLFLTAEDLMKYAVMMLQNGQWEGEQVVSESWTREASKQHVSTEKWKQSYGYHWWVSESVNHQPEFYYAAGRGGKFIFICPEQQLAVTVTANLSTKDSLLPYQWFVKYIINKD
ncbi:serine hydrolase domain-containing protein [Salipaludibacillus daqingensis]|uniref:serine hydrolase domain-containing protein n=1 Tax=Salipaludibacillus daqingensis TaxID=3041001 RepID=UPI0024742A58|nr:serine hydrolase [Salipaludibacillus daqingensis]